MKLYKYKEINDFSKRILIDKKIWYAIPTSFNDPFDCGIDLSLNMSLKEKVEVLKNRMNQEGWTKEKIEQQLNLSFDQCGRLNDKAENNILKIRDDIQKKRDNAGVLSLSASNNKMLMWSHYTKGHTGFCIEFEVDKKSNSISEVKYKEDIPQYTLHDIFIKKNATVFDLLITKHIGWKYEKEYRIILDKGNIAYDLPGKITSVIFGLKTTSKDIEEVKKIAILNYPDIQFKKCTKSQNKFEILIENL